MSVMLPHRRALLTSPVQRSSLLDQLVAYWKLDEASGTRADSAGSNVLTDNNTVTQAAGKVGNAAQFTAANNESLSHVSNSTLQTGDIDWTIAFWVNPNNLSATRGLVNRANGISGTSEYQTLVLTNGVVRLQIYGDSGQVGQVDSSAISASAWSLVIFSHDAVNNQVSISINAGAPATAATTGPMHVSTAVLNIGARSSDLYFDGLIDEVGFWKRILTSTERTRLYNSGAGVTWPLF